MILMTQQEVIKAFMKSLDETSKTGEAALNEAVKACSTFKSFTALKAAMIKDCKNAKSGNDFLKTYCGIDYSTEDNGAITGSDAGGSTSKTDASIVPESGSLKNFTGSSFKVNNLTVKLSGKTYSQLSAAQKFIWQGLYTWWVKNSLDLIAESYGDNFSYGSDSSATTKTLYVNFFYKSSTTSAYTSSDFNSAGKTYKTTLNINMYHWGSLPSDLDKANSNFDHFIVAHELTHAVMHANINANVFKTLPAFVTEGIAELTHGIENTRETALKALAKNSSLLSKTLVLNTNSVTVSGVSNPGYAGGYMFFRYLARQAGDLTIDNETKNTTVKTFYGNDTITNTASSVTIESGAGKDSITNHGDKVSIVCGAGNDSVLSFGSKVTIDGGAGNDTLRGGDGNDSIAGGSGNDKIYGGAGKDTLWGGAGNDSLWGGSGNDTFIYQAGSGTDTIFDYKSGDMLKILKSNGYSGGKYTKSKFSGGTLSLTISGGGNVIFENVTAATTFNINDNSYKVSGSKLVKR